MSFYNISTEVKTKKIYSYQQDSMGYQEVNVPVAKELVRS